LLNFDQGALGRDFEDECRIAEQRAISDRRHEGVSRALDNLEPDSTPAKLRT
jgi:hypothetical protein